MLSVLRKRFNGFINNGIVEIHDHDLRHGLPPMPPHDLVIAVLSFCFVPVDHRFELLQEVVDNMKSGATLIIVEKILGTGRMATMQKLIYRRHKLTGGYSEDEVDRKALSLEGRLVPMTAPAIEQMLSHAGLQQFDCFWRWMNFAGWVAIK